jgi:hypothetical protein
MASASLHLQVSTQTTEMSTVAERVVYFFKASTEKIEQHVCVYRVCMILASTMLTRPAMLVLQNVASVVYTGELSHAYLRDGIHLLRVSQLCRCARSAFACCACRRQAVSSDF